MKNLEVRSSGEVGYVGGDLLAIVYPVEECPRSRAEHRNNSKRIVESWNQYDALKASNAELLSALESLVLFSKPAKANAAALNLAHQVIAKNRGQQP